MNKKLDTIQALRGIAALSVVLFHYRFYLKGDITSSTIWDSLFSWGIIGVDIFFVISGFIMAYTTNHYTPGIASAKKFITNRFIRIIPLYYILLLVAFLLGGAMRIFHYPEKVQNLISALTFTVYNPNITPHYIDDSGMFNIRWTLNYELYFYIMFAVCLLFRFRYLMLALWAALAVFLIPMALGNSPTLSINGYKVQTAAYGFFSNPIILEFLVGVVSGYFYTKIEHKIKEKWANLFAFISLFLLCIICYGIYSKMLYALTPTTVIILGALIFCISIGEVKIRKYLPNFLLTLGNISFSLYLIHNPLSAAIFKRLGDANKAPMLGIPYFILTIAISIVAAYFIHKYIEVKLTHWLKERFVAKSNTSSSQAEVNQQ